jgi:PIN domain nuclease of toxin-antitoxin system
MTILLDTHVLIWAATTPERLGPQTGRLVESTATDVASSAVSVAEIVIKQKLGKLTGAIDPVEVCSRLGFGILDLTAVHALGLTSLPLLHRDPFDRLLIAQAIATGRTLVTADATVLGYPDVSLLDARS